MSKSKIPTRTGLIDMAFYCRLKDAEVREIDGKAEYRSKYPPKEWKPVSPHQLSSIRWDAPILANIAGLVREGLIDLDEVFDKAGWSEEEEIGTYTDLCYPYEEGRFGCAKSGGLCMVVLQVAAAYGITAYRYHDDSSDDSGTVYLDRKEAIEDGKEHLDEMREYAQSELAK